MQVAVKSCARVNCAEAADLLRAGHLVLVPTETVYGIAGDPAVDGIEDAIYASKERDRGKPIPLLAASLADVEAYGAELNEAERALASAFWPGPLTLVLHTSARFQVSGFRFQPSEGFRVPACEVTLELLQAAGHPLRVTSANVSGDVPAVTETQAIEALGKHVAGVVAWDGTCGGEPSTVARTRNAEHGTRIEILREGALSRKQLEAALKGTDS